MVYTNGVKDIMNEEEDTISSRFESETKLLDRPARRNLSLFVY